MSGAESAVADGLFVEEPGVLVVDVGPADVGAGDARCVVAGDAATGADAAVVGLLGDLAEAPSRFRRALATLAVLGVHPQVAVLPEFSQLGPVAFRLRLSFWRYRHHGHGRDPSPRGMRVLKH
jgi:hypothetical protein